MSAKVRATCPGCQTVLRIPAEWADRSVKCKKCGAVVPGQPKASPPVPAKPIVATPVAAPPSGPQPPLARAVPVPIDPLVYPPAYVPPPAAPAEFTNPALDFEPLPLPARYRGRSGVGMYVGFVFALLILGALAAGVYFAAPYVRDYRDKLLADAGPKEPPPTQAEPSIAAPVKAPVPFPRRMLVMHASKYLYCNGLSAGSGELTPDRVARRLAFDWRVPRENDANQLYVLSDTAPKDARPMLRPIVMETYKRFCETSRPQDRVVLYFGGHATTKDDKAYLVPTDGDLGDAETLIPLDDFWSRVKGCQAQQKVVVFDVCRLNEDGDTVRPGSEPMSPELEKALLAAPHGVQVVTTCAAGQNALEFRRPRADLTETEVTGSLFLAALKHVADKGTANGDRAPTPEDPLPVARWVEAARARMKEVAKATDMPAPTPKVAGSDVGDAVALNPDEPPASRFDFPAPPKGVAPTEVAGIATRITLPPLRANRSTTDKEKSLDELIPFAEAAMKGHMPDGISDSDIRDEPEKYPLRKAALDTLAALKTSWDRLGESGVRDRFVQETSDAVKKLIIAEQETPALIGLELKSRVQAMEPLLEQLDKEPSKYWQATFLYALAQAKARLAFIEEYNYALGNIRTDSLPQKDEKKGHVGLQLVSVEKMKSKKEIKEIADSSKELFARVVKEHQGTPWAVQAKRDGAVALGLEWRPFSGTER
ncbi:MAG TPA: caspase family protein [Fimbriiglobus sp.]|nr:caspase family protein [Fimbriiglobus sp.]